MFATFHRDEFPLIEIRFTGEKETSENFQAYLDGLEANYERKERISLIFDASAALPLNPVYQLKQANWMKKHDDLIRKYCVGVAYVIPGALLRNTLKLIFKLQSSPTTFKVFRKHSDARAWARGLLKSA
jgi:hypothetical protein